MVYLSANIPQQALSLVKLRKPYETKGLSTLRLFDCLQILSSRQQEPGRSIRDPRKSRKNPENTPGNQLLLRSALRLKNTTFDDSDEETYAISPILGGTFFFGTRRRQKPCFFKENSIKFAKIFAHEARVFPAI